MSSTRKSKKGFKRLENHELADFTSMGNGALGESGSENDLLDLTPVEEKEPQGRCNSCCCWCSTLYFGILTCLLFLVGAYCGYLTINLWDMTDRTTTTHEGLEARLKGIEKWHSDYKHEVDQKYSSLDREMVTLKESLNQTQGSLAALKQKMENSVHELDVDVKDIDARLKVAESKPQDMLIKEVDIINRDMGVLNTSMHKLNTSLADINLVKKQMTELGVSINRYDNQLSELKKGMADVRLGHSRMKESVDAAVNGVADFETDLKGVSSSVTETHNQMQQTTELLSAKVTNVQLLVTGLNDTLLEEVDRLWTNVSQAQSSLETLSNTVHSVEEELVGLQSQLPSIVNPQPDSGTPDSQPATTSAPTTSSTLPLTTRPPLSSGSTTSSSLPLTTRPPLSSGSTTSSTLLPTTRPPLSSGSTTQPSIHTESASTEGQTTDNVNEGLGADLTPSSEPITHSTESTGATEDKPGFTLNKTDTESNIGTTVATEDGLNKGTEVGSENGTSPTQDSSNMDEEIAKERNTTQSAINLLQSLLEDYMRMDQDDDGEVTMDEFVTIIPKPFIFKLLDTNHDSSLTYSEILANVNALRLKLAELSQEAENRENSVTEETEASTDEDQISSVTTDADTTVEAADPELQKKLKELYEYIMNG